MQVSKNIAAVQVAPAAPGDPEINLDLANLSPRKRIVYRFYKQLWDKGDLAAIAELCQENFSFRGSLGPDLIGQSQFREYVCWVTETLDGYTSDILALIEEADQIAVKLRFHGRHRKALFGCPATGDRVWWDGLAIFSFEGLKIRHLWVLGDIHGLLGRLGAGISHRAEFTLQNSERCST